MAQEMEQPLGNREVPNSVPGSLRGGVEVSLSKTQNHKIAPNDRLGCEQVGALFPHWYLNGAMPSVLHPISPNLSRSNEMSD